jgi:hypothetical protein
MVCEKLLIGAGWRVIKKSTYAHIEFVSFISHLIITHLFHFA